MILETVATFAAVALVVFVGLAMVERAVRWLWRWRCWRGWMLALALGAGAAGCGGDGTVGSVMSRLIPTPTGVDACYEPPIDVWHIRWDLDGYEHLVEVGEDVPCDMGASCPQWGGVAPATAPEGASYSGRTVFRWVRTWVRVRATDGVDQGPASSPLLRTVSSVCPFPWYFRAPLLETWPES